jgi:hypothetical protein
MIWELLLPGPRIIQIEPPEMKIFRIRYHGSLAEDDRPRHGLRDELSLRIWGPRAFCQPVPIKLLATCRESYEVASKAYPRMMEKPLERLANAEPFFTLRQTPDILFSFKEDTLYLNNRSLHKLWRVQFISQFKAAEGFDLLGVDLNRVDKLALGLGAVFEFGAAIWWISEVLSWFNNLKQVTFAEEYHDRDGGSNLVSMDLDEIPVLSLLYEEGYSQSHSLRDVLRHEQSYTLQAQER